MPVISGALLGSILTLGAIFIGIAAGVVAWMIRRLLNLEDDVAEISQSYGGGEYSEGHLKETRRSFERIEQHLDDLENTISYQERRRVEEHEELRGLVGRIVESLHKSDINGNLPSPDDIEPSDD